MVVPTFNGVNRVSAVSEAVLIVTGAATVPTDGSELVMLIVSETPARSGCTVTSADRWVTGSR